MVRMEKVQVGQLVVGEWMVVNIEMVLNHHW